MNLSKMSSKTSGCGGDQCGCPSAKPKKGDKLDTQLFPKCKGTKYDRDIVKKTRERKKRGDKKSSSEDHMTRKARFGEDMDGIDGMLWKTWKSKRYFTDNRMPSPQEAKNFIDYCDELFNRSVGTFISVGNGQDGEASYDRIQEKIDIVRTLPDRNVPSIEEKAQQYQALMYEIEQDQAGIIDEQEPLEDGVVASVKFNLKQYRESQKKD